MKHLLIGFVALIVIATSASCKKGAVPEVVIPPTPKPTLDITIKPSTRVEYGDSATVSFTSTATSLVVNGQTLPTPTSGSVVLRLLKRDTTLSFIANGPGGVTTIEKKIVVDPITEEVATLLRGKDVGKWRLRELYQWGPKPNSTEEGWNSALNNPENCLFQSVHTFSLGKDYKKDDACDPEAPKGKSIWYFTTDPESKRLILGISANILNGKFVSWSPDKKTMYLEDDFKRQSGVIRSLWVYKAFN